MLDARAVNGEAAPTDHGPPSPYVGLSFYRAEDADFFFGRESERQVVMSNLRAARLTLLHADSGVGKSSLLRAGVAARLDQIARSKFSLGDAIDVPVVFSSWKDDPINELIGEMERTVNSYLPADEAVALSRDSLTDAVTGAVRALDVVAATNRDVTSPTQPADLDPDDRPSSSLLIILDQFEEYFLYGSTVVRERLADELSAAINKPDLSANFLISIREETFAALGNLLRSRMRNVYGNDLHLDYLDSKHAREAVERPVDRFNHLYPDRWVEIEDGLVEALLLEVRREQNGNRQAADGVVPIDFELPKADGAAVADSDGHNGEVITPYLQLVMTKLWEHDQPSGLLQLRTLEELHGARQIVADHLSEALSSLQAEQRDIAIESLHHLVTPSGTKIALEVGDLAAYTRRPVEQVASVLEALAGDARILRTVPPAPGKSADDPANQRYEIYHDVLARPINQVVNARSVEHERGRAARFRRIAAGALALALVAVVAAIVAVVALRDASRQKQAAQSGQLAAAAESQLSSNPQVATQLALSAWQVHHTSLAERALRDALPQLQLQRTLQARPPVSSVAFSPDGGLVAVANSDGVASLWDTGTDKQVGALGVPGLSALDSVAFSPDGSRLVTAYGDGTARIWNVMTHRQIGQPLTQHVQGDLESAVFSPDGKELVTAGNSGVASVWDVRTHRLLRALSLSGRAPLTDAAFSPDGKLIAASSSYGELVVWSATTYQPVASQTSAGSPLYSVAFSPDSKSLITATGQDQAFIWKVDNLGQPKRQFSGGDLNTINPITNAMWSGRGRLIVASALDGQAWVWNAFSTSSKPARTLRAGNVSMLSIAADARGDRIVTAGADGVARIWDAHSGKQLAVLPTAGVDIVNAASFSSDGSLIGNATYEGNVNMWAAATGKLLFHYTLPNRAGANDIRIRRVNGRDMAIVAGGDGFVHVIDAATGGLMGEIDPPVARNITAADYSPSSGEWVTADQESSRWVIRLWRFSGSSWQTGSFTEVGNQKGLREPSSVGYIYDAEFSPDGRRIVVASDDGSARVWSSGGNDPKPLATFTDQFNSRAQGLAIRSAVFNLDGTRVLTASADGTARIWDAAGRKHSPIGTITDPQGDQLRWAAYSPDSRWVATAGQDGIVRVWDSASQRELLTLAGHSGAVNTVRFNSLGTRLATASTDGTTRLWDALPVEEQGYPIYRQPQADVITVAFSPNGRVIATANADGYARLWNAVTDQHRLIAAIPDPGGSGVLSAEYSRDGHWLVTGDANGNAALWDSSTRHQLAPLVDPYMYSLSSTEISPDRTMIVTAGTATANAPADGQDGAAIWGVRQSASGKRVRVKLMRRLQAGSALRWAAFSPDSRLIVTSDNGGVARIWDAATGTQVGATLTEPGGESVSDAWFSPPLARSAPQWLRQMVQESTLRLGSRREPWLIVTGSDDGTARVWNMRTGAQLAVFAEPGRSEIYNAVFSPNGQFVLTASQDGTARIWSLKTGAQMTQFNAGDPIADAEFSPSGDRVVVGTTFGTARVFWTTLDEPMARLVALAHSRLTSQLTGAQRQRFLSSG